VLDIEGSLSTEHIRDPVPAIDTSDSVLQSVEFDDIVRRFTQEFTGEPTAQAGNLIVLFGIGARYCHDFYRSPNGEAGSERLHATWPFMYQNFLDTLRIIEDSSERSENPFEIMHYYLRCTDVRKVPATSRVTPVARTVKQFNRNLEQVYDLHQQFSEKRSVPSLHSKVVLLKFSDFIGNSGEHWFLRTHRPYLGNRHPIPARSISADLLYEFYDAPHPGLARIVQEQLDWQKDYFDQSIKQ
jgi:hypothetical protein